MRDAEKSEMSLGYWSGRAREYSQLHEDELASDRGAAFGRLVASLARKARESVGAGDGGGRPLRALDLGCGSGMMSVLLAFAGCEVTGVDFSADMLAQARENARVHGVEGSVAFVRADVHRLPFDDASFDLVLTRNVTWVLDRVEDVYAQALRVLGPGGMFANIDAAYGQAFAAAAARGEEPVHPTQSAEQLRTRNAIVADLPISRVDRPAWDVRALQALGAARVVCDCDLEATLAGLARDGAAPLALRPACDSAAFSRASEQTRAQLFMVVAVRWGACGRRGVCGGRRAEARQNRAIVCAKARAAPRGSRRDGAPPDGV